MIYSLIQSHLGALLKKKYWSVKKAIKNNYLKKEIKVEEADVEDRKMDKVFRINQKKAWLHLILFQIISI